MADIGDSLLRYHRIPPDSLDAHPASRWRWLKMSAAIISGSCLVSVALISASCLGLLSTVDNSVSTHTLDSTGVAKSTSLTSLPNFLRSPQINNGPSPAQLRTMGSPIGSSFGVMSPWKQLSVRPPVTGHGTAPTLILGSSSHIPRAVPESRVPESRIHEGRRADVRAKAESSAATAELSKEQELRLSKLGEESHLARMPTDVRDFVITVDEIVEKRGEAWTLPIADVRANYDSLLYMTELPSSVSTEDISVDGPDGPVPVRIYFPLNHPTDQKLPVTMFIHGGGWTVGSVDGYDGVVQHLCNRSGTAFVSVDYRLSPEHKAPAAERDCFAVLEWLAAGAHGFALRSDAIGVCGDSAGGNLAAVMAIKAKQAGIALRFQALLFPTTNMNFPVLQGSNSTSAFANAKVFLPKTRMSWYVDQYVKGSKIDRSDWRVSPIYAPMELLQDVAPALVVTGSHDILLDEGRAYYERLKAAGIPTEYREYEGQVHVFMLCGKFISQAEPALNMVAADIDRFFGMETPRLSAEALAEEELWKAEAETKRVSALKGLSSTWKTLARKLITGDENMSIRGKLTSEISWLRKFLTAAGAAQETFKTQMQDPAAGAAVIETQMQGSSKVSASDAFKAASGIDVALYQEAKADRLAFWEARARELQWFQPWGEVLRWKRPYAEWFVGGKLNAAYNCLDVHLEKKGSKKALVWEGEKGGVREFTYRELYEAVNRLSSKMETELGVKKGDRVIIHMPMVPELVIAVLACARIGAVHSVVFGGFSAGVLKDRIEMTEPKCVLTADGGYRRGKVIPLKPMLDTALEELSQKWQNYYGGGSSEALKVVVVQCLDELDRGTTAMKAGRDIFYDDLVKDAPTEWPAERMDSEDPLFILFSSGTTGKPKGILHTTGGYMTQAKYSTRTVFDLQDDDVYWCTADVGWITGHTYLVYGPLANAATIVMFEGTPDYPGKDRFWDVIERHKVSVFYTAPTAIRAFMKWGVEHVQKHNLGSLRMLGSVGEPINPEAWRWFHENVGGGRCPIVDTWFQTETGSIMVSNLPALNDMKPGQAGLPLPGVEVSILGKNGEVVQDGGGYLSITQPWPSMLRGLYGDNKRYQETYWSRFGTYFSGDGATIDKDGYITVLGRVDDVLNVAGHRIGTMEVESVLVGCDGVAEAAVVGVPDKIKFQGILALVILREGVEPSDAKKQELMQQVAKDIGAFARPQCIIFTPELPKTRSGKIMRRILKNLALGDQLFASRADLSTLVNPDIIKTLEQAYVDCGLLEDALLFPETDVAR